MKVKVKNGENVKRSFFQKHNQSLKAAGWGIAGLIVSIPMMRARISLFGYPLFVLSLIMFIVAARVYYGEVKGKIR